MNISLDFKSLITIFSLIVSLGFNFYQIHRYRVTRSLMGTSLHHSWHQLIAMKESCEIFGTNHSRKEGNDVLAAARTCINGLCTNSSRLADSIEKDSKNLKLGHPGEKK